MFHSTGVIYEDNFCQQGVGRPDDDDEDKDNDYDGHDDQDDGDDQFNDDDGHDDEEVALSSRITDTSDRWWMSTFN